ncbi:AMIN domain-containing protein [Massilia dura]|uniref:N-acetylmuramoyl-L-alanine amidase AmiC n=1 Tax=Pseudoduganella dura TaxID=321982 RepID=A0A6I3XP03_9BURK|nr:N-acetylmuramoyl-L-alanine amidase [Pseudoduganella dura]MUI14358.1 AMIN domain-containing protein [Pseudoduganella dura]GGY05383.1 N-acetylmuramoyl-L-alanine amidase [Pseudoduganella dura]
MPATPPLPADPLIPAQADQGRRRRILLKAGGTLLLSVLAPLPARAAQILAVRVWPADEYTRVTLENDSDLKTSHFIVKDPDRLVVDIEGLDLNPELKSLVAKVQSNDPYIKQVRVGQNRPGVVRLVFDLKAQIRPQVFTLAPVGEYKHRLIFDLYPVREVDPIAAMIEKGEWSSDGTPVGQPPLAEQHPAPGLPLPDNRIPAPGVPSEAVPRPDIAAKTEPPKPEAPKNTDRLVRMLTVALDPGHGGEDPGAIGSRGSREKDIVLAIAKRLKAKLEQHPNMRVMLTRDGDFFVPLNVRVEKARKVDADLFISIHADAFIKPSARGSSVFVLSEKSASSSAARWLANKENQADLIGGANTKGHDPQLASVLFDLSTTAQINDSLKVGKAVLQQIGGINKLHNGAVERAGFAVLKAPDIPSILIETAFISNPEEEARLLDNNYQDQIADAIVKGIRAYFAKNPPLAKNRLT